MRGSSCSTEVCQREFSHLQAEYLRLEDNLHAERESHAAQVSAMLEERDAARAEVARLGASLSATEHDLAEARTKLRLMASGSETSCELVASLVEERDAARAACDAYRAMLCDLLACHGRVRLGGESDGELWVRARRLLAEEP